MFKNALNKTPTLQVRPKQVAAPENRSTKLDVSDLTPETPITFVIPNPDVPRIERVINKSRIDLFFPAKPSQETRAKLKHGGCWWNENRMCWELRDTADNRVWLEYEFGTVFEDSAPEAPKPEAPKPEAPTPLGDYEPLPALARYRQQVDELIKVLQVPPADLLLIAIDYLHAAKVNR